VCWRWHHSYRHDVVYISLANDLARSAVVPFVRSHYYSFLKLANNPSSVAMACRPRLVYDPAVRCAGALPMLICLIGCFRVHKTNNYAASRFLRFMIN